MRRVWGGTICLWGVLAAATAARGDEPDPVAVAIESIRANDLRKHLNVLASDTFEGRAAGSRGGKAAGIYIGQHFQKHKLRGRGDRDSYYQDFNYEYRNILGWIPGSDPQFRDDFLLIGAHYDHVGYGNAQNSSGPIGYIHNGADDNGSGTVAVLEILEAFAGLNIAPKRSIVFALWDAEELGMVGSRHWASQPTVPLDRLKFAVNIDMCGRLHKKPLEVYGWRTMPGLRQLLSRHNDATRLTFDYTWEIPNNSDHYTFYQRQIPFVMPFTGYHADYHRPSDDVDKVDLEGMQQIGRWLFGVMHELADAPTLPVFRAAVLAESVAQQRQVDAPLPPHPSRLGCQWNAKAGFRIEQVYAPSAAATAGLRTGDRLIEFAGRELRPDTNLDELILSSPSPVTAVVESGPAKARRTIAIPLAGKPVRLGITWWEDSAEPGVLVLNRVDAGSPAAQAGLQVSDRVCEAGGEPFANAAAFRQLIAAPGPLELLIERGGRRQTVTLELP